MKYIKNEKGVTLIEVLAAIVILSVILGSIINFFPQIGFVNKTNEEKAEAMNTAKLILHNWQNDSNIKNFLKNSQTEGLTVQPQNITDDNFSYFNYNYTSSNGGECVVNIKIAKKRPTNFPAGTTEIRYIQVKVQNSQSDMVSETYGYIKYN